MGSESGAWAHRMRLNSPCQPELGRGFAFSVLLQTRHLPRSTGQVHSKAATVIAPKRLSIWLLVLSTLLFAGSAYSQPALIVAIGDSNTAGFGVGRENAFPARLEAMLRMTGYDVEVSNAGISGDTLRGILARLDRYAPPRTRIVIVQGGYNDVWRGRSSATLVASIEAILSHLAARQTKTVLCGFHNQGWDAVGRALAERYGAVFVDGSACYDRRYRGLDLLHMTATGHQVVAARLLPVIQGLLLPSRPCQPDQHCRPSHTTVLQQPSRR
jgi:acyl-CoA thioesterase-1